MNNLDIISLMVEETFNDKSRTFSIIKDEKRRCFVLHLAEETELEIPFGHGPFHSELTHPILNTDDNYLYPYLNQLLGIEEGIYEISLEENRVYLHLEDYSSNFAA